MNEVTPIVTIVTEVSFCVFAKRVGHLKASKLSEIP